MSERKKNELRDHVFDGIQEYDNDMPQWWIILFWITIAFSAGYMIWYHLPLGETRGLLAEYDAVVAEEAKARAAAQELKGDSTFDWEAAAKDKVLIARAQETWSAMCIPCHLASGGGSVGPNLTDRAWIHGHTPEALTKIITSGALENGMPAWGPILGDEKIRELVVFIQTIKNTHVSDGKAPQGDIIDDAP